MSAIPNELLLQVLKQDIIEHAEQIAGCFKECVHVTVIVRHTNRANSDVVVSSDPKLEDLVRLELLQVTEEVK